MKTSVEELIELLSPAINEVIPQAVLKLRRDRELSGWPYGNHREIYPMIRGESVVMSRSSSESSAALELTLGPEFQWKHTIVTVIRYHNPSYPEDQIVHVTVVYNSCPVGNVIIHDLKDSGSARGINYQLCFDEVSDMANATSLLYAVAIAIETFCEKAQMTP